MTVRVEHGDSRDVVRTLPDGSVDSCVCDPPYNLKFMGKAWDTGEVAYDPAFWREVLRVLKPGAHVLAFGGTRTYHRLAVAIDDAGFEIRDAIQWLYGSGFPKSHNVGKAIDKAAGATREVLSEGAPVKRMIPGADQNREGWEKTNGRVFVPLATAPATDAARQWEGWGTALKPACEIICVARKPLIGTVAANVLAHGTGALNIDGCRVEGAKPDTTRGAGGQHGAYSPIAAQGRILDDGRGRWPANVVHDGSDEVLNSFPRTASGSGAIKRNSGAGYKGNALGNESRPVGAAMLCYGDEGSAGRFFYTTKADAADRLGSKHPTVKPVDLMRWLVRLVTPGGGTVLDPFAGSGTTGMACLAEGFDAILIEREEEYVADIRRRLDHVSGVDAPLFAGIP